MTVGEVRAASLWWAYRSTKAKRELGWKPSHHEDTLVDDDRLVPQPRGRPHGAAGHAPARWRCGSPASACARPAGVAGGAARLMATLYRCRTPTNVLCPCGRVARELRRQGIEADEVRVPWRKRDRDEVAALSGQRAVPTLVLDGEAICDSQRIVEHLRGGRRRPHDAADRRRPDALPSGVMLRRAAALALLGLAPATAAHAAGPPTMPLGDVRAGMACTARVGRARARRSSSFDARIDEVISGGSDPARLAPAR